MGWNLSFVITVNDLTGLNCSVVIVRLKRAKPQILVLDEIQCLCQDGETDQGAAGSKFHIFILVKLYKQPKETNNKP